MLDIQNCCLVVVDLQGKLAQLMHEKEKLFENVAVLIKAAKILSIPIIWCQQVPEALGATIGEIAELLGDNEPVNKATFSCCGNEKFNERCGNKKQILLCGIETHVCIYQTAVDLKTQGREVYIIADAVSSRTQQNKQIALERIRATGAIISSTEMALFELLKTAKHPNFREIAKLIK